MSPSEGYVHVLDDVTLEIVLGTLDTVSDFIEYLTKKEEFITSGRLRFAAGEEDLLAYYLQHFDDNGLKDFVIPENVDAISIDEGAWREFVRHPRRIAQLAANEVSYAWDGLVESFLHHLLAGTQYFKTEIGVATQEHLLRFLARENRTRRRFLATQLLDMIETTPSADIRRTRVMKPDRDGDPYYVFLLLPHWLSRTYDENRRIRADVMRGCCLVTKLMFPDALDIVGIATETGQDLERSEDAYYFDAREWTAEDEAQAIEWQQSVGLLTQTQEHRSTYHEYPDPILIRHPSTEIEQVQSSRVKGNQRNKPCSCGSGKKYKRCCGAPVRR